MLKLKGEKLHGTQGTSVKSESIFLNFEGCNQKKKIALDCQLDLDNGSIESCIFYFGMFEQSSSSWISMINSKPSTSIVMDCHRAMNRKEETEKLILNFLHLF